MIWSFRSFFLSNVRWQIGLNFLLSNYFDANLPIRKSNKNQTKVLITSSNHLWYILSLNQQHKIYWLSLEFTCKSDYSLYKWGGHVHAASRADLPTSILKTPTVTSLHRCHSTFLKKFYFSLTNIIPFDWFCLWIRLELCCDHDEHPGKQC